MARFLSNQIGLFAKKLVKNSLCTEVIVGILLIGFGNARGGYEQQRPSYRTLDVETEKLESGLEATVLPVAGWHDDVSIVVDNENNPHIVYQNADQKVEMAEVHNGKWRAITLSVGLGSDGGDNSIVMDNEGYFHISSSESDGCDENLLYFTNKDGWKLHRVAWRGSVGIDNDIAIDSNGNVHISHWQWVSDYRNYGNLLYSTNKSGDWQTSILDDRAGGTTNIAVDNSNDVYILHSSSKLIVLDNVTGEWTLERLPSGNDVQEMVMDANNILHGISPAVSIRDLSYSTSGDGWQPHLVSPTTWGYMNRKNFEDTSIALDSDGNVHIVARISDWSVFSHSSITEYNSSLLYFTNKFGAWKEFLIDRGLACHRGGITVDKEGNVHIAYSEDVFEGVPLQPPYYDFARNIKYVKFNPSELFLPHKLMTGLCYRPYREWQDPTQQLSVEAWVSPAANNNLAVIVKKSDLDQKNGYSLEGSSHITKKINTFRFGIYNGICPKNDPVGIPQGWCATGSSPSLEAEKWHHLVGIYNGSTLKLYLNGELIPNSEVSVSGNINVSTNSLMIGKDPSNPTASNRFFKGKIDEVAIYNRALTEEEIEDNYNNGVGRDYCEQSQSCPTEMKAYWKLDESPQTHLGIVADSSGNGHIGTFYSYDGTANKSINGKLGYALSFDGINDYVEIPTNDRGEIKEDLFFISKLTPYIRTYGIDDVLFDIPRICYDNGLRVFAGVWLSSDPLANEGAIEDALRLAREKYYSLEAIVVGNEAVSRGDLTIAQLSNYIQRIDEELLKIDNMRKFIGNSRPFVTTADTWNVWLENTELLDVTDIIMVNIHPYWDGINVANAASYVVDRYKEVDALTSKYIVVSEVGWPSEGEIVGNAVPSSENQRRFLLEFRQLAEVNKIPYLYFEAYDRPFGANHEGGVGTHWGLVDADGRIKPSLEAILPEGFSTISQE